MVAQRVARPGEINHAFLDPYSLVHGGIGVVAALVVGLGFWSTLAIAISWELVEHAFKNIAPFLFPHPTQDTFANSMGDVLSTLVGWSSARAIRARRHAADAS